MFVCVWAREMFVSDGKVIAQMRKSGSDSREEREKKDSLHIREASESDSGT
jgi:hypothetical protein